MFILKDLIHYSCLIFSKLLIYNSHFRFDVSLMLETTVKFLDILKANTDTKSLV